MDVCFSILHPLLLSFFTSFPLTFSHFLRPGVVFAFFVKARQALLSFQPLINPQPTKPNIMFSSSLYTTLSVLALSSSVLGATTASFGSCSTPQIKFAAGLDGRRETAFAPVDLSKIFPFRFSKKHYI